MPDAPVPVPVMNADEVEKSTFPPRRGGNQACQNRSVLDIGQFSPFKIAVASLRHGWR